MTTHQTLVEQVCSETIGPAGQSADEVLDLAMRVCGGAAFRKEVERFGTIDQFVRRLTAQRK